MIPLGQKYREDFPRFGLPDYAKRFPTRLNDQSITIKVNQSAEVEISDVSLIFLALLRKQISIVLRLGHTLMPNGVA